MRTYLIAAMALAGAQSVLAQTYIEPLRLDWAAAKARAQQAIEKGELRAPGRVPDPQLRSGLDGLSRAMGAGARATADMGSHVQKYGVYAFFYEDPAHDANKSEFANALAQGLSGLSKAIADDMVRGARQAGVGQGR